MSKAVKIHKCTNPDCGASGRQAGVKNVSTDDQATIAYAESNSCGFCGSKLKVVNMD